MYPLEMTSKTRWMIRPDDPKVKQPMSLWEEEPPGYAGEQPWNRYRWGCPSQWSTYDEVKDYDGELCFVVRDDSPDIKRRFVVFDFDHCTDDTLPNEVQAPVAWFLEDKPTFAEFSQSGQGVHAYYEYVGPPLKTKKYDIDGIPVDIITSGQIVTTGKALCPGKVSEISLDILLAFGMEEKAPKADGDCWGPENLELPKHLDHLADTMRTWPPCVEGHGGDKELFKAACHIARYGVTGEAARYLLSMVEARPEFSEAEIDHKIESAYATVSGQGEFNIYGQSPEEVFGSNVDGATLTDEEKQFFKDTGFEGLELGRHMELFSKDDMPEFIVKDVLFERGALMIGGPNKAFKTTIGIDLLVSLATRTKFLGSFPILCDCKNVALFSAETKEHIMSMYLHTILDSKDLTVGDISTSFTINSSVPSFFMDKTGQMRVRKGFREYLEQKKPDIVMFDPVYQMFCGVNQADRSSEGQAYKFVERFCEEYGAMCIFCHHFTKTASREGDGSLEAMSGAGAGAFTRQWILLNHTRKYAEGSARLKASVGASGADEQKWIIEADTYDDDRERIWKTRAFKVNMVEEIIHRLQTDGPLTIKQLSGKLDAEEHAIDKLAKKLITDGRLSLLKQRLYLKSQLSGEVDF